MYKDSPDIINKHNHKYMYYITIRNITSKCESDSKKVELEAHMNLYRSPGKEDFIAYHSIY